jgi:hypothetical protein
MYADGSVRLFVDDDGHDPGDPLHRRLALLLMGTASVIPDLAGVERVRFVYL